MRTTHVIAKGHVQGVYFRDYTRRQAIQLNLTGWVRNLPDGSVEATLCGREIDVSSMLDWFKQGSPLSRVDNLLVEKIESDEAFTAFEIRY